MTAIQTGARRPTVGTGIGYSDAIQSVACSLICLPVQEACRVGVADIGTRANLDAAKTGPSHHAARAGHYFGVGNGA